jgi:hypothetical protein
MTDNKSINASERLENSDSVMDFVLTGGIYGSMFGSSRPDPDSKPNNAPASGVNPTHCTERAVQ